MNEEVVWSGGPLISREILDEAYFKHQGTSLSEPLVERKAALPLGASLRQRVEIKES